MEYLKIAAAMAVIAVALLLVRKLTHVILPILLRVKSNRSLSLRDRVILRYQHKDFHAWMFAWFKTRLDVMFDELPGLLIGIPKPEKILDIGCGFGIAGSFLLELFGGAEIFAVDPNPGRVRGAAAALGDRGKVHLGAAPNFEQPDFPDRFDLVVALDMLHFLGDSELDLTLQKIRALLGARGYLVIRTPVRPMGFGSLKWHMYRLNAIRTGARVVFRTVEQVRQKLADAGFDLIKSQLSGKNPELFWFISTASAGVMPKQKRGNQQSDHDGMDHDQPEKIKGAELVPLL